MGLFSQLIYKRSPATPKAVLAPATAPLPASMMRWKTDTSVTLPDWDDLPAPADASDEELSRFWSSAARAWLEALARNLGPNHSIVESNEFMLLSPLAEHASGKVLEYADKTRERILQVLPGIARDDGYGKTVILIFDSADHYYRYISHYYPDSANDRELAFSSGMFIDEGYGHFAFVSDELGRLEPIIAHELTHCLVRHLPLPAWVNEGIAVSIEHRLCPPHGSLYTLDELQQKHSAFWDKHTIQEFWSGKSWLRPDDGNLLSYDLAKTFITLAAQEWSSFVAFVNAADHADGAEIAARQHLGYSLGHLADAVLGKGGWSPDPACWRSGTERGQFAQRSNQT